MQNLITVKFATEISFNTLEKKTVKERIIHDLPDTFKFSYRTAISRICQNNFAAKGRDGPLAKIESHITTLLIYMSKLKCSLRTSEGLE